MCLLFLCPCEPSSQLVRIMSLKLYRNLKLVLFLIILSNLLASCWFIFLHELDYLFFQQFFHCLLVQWFLSNVEFLNIFFQSLKMFSGFPGILIRRIALPFNQVLVLLRYWIISTIQYFFNFIQVLTHSIYNINKKNNNPLIFSLVIFVLYLNNPP